MIQQKQLQVEPKVVQILADALGADMNRIEKELEKLMSGLPEGTKMTMENCEAIEHWTQHPPRYTEAPLISST